MQKKIIYIFIILMLFQYLFSCTIGGAYDHQGRPFIFKVRDRDKDHQDNKLFYNTSEGGYSYVGNINIGTSNIDRTWMGVNDRGFAIVNAMVPPADSTYLDGDFSDNGEFMHAALSSCSTYQSFIDLLETESFIVSGNFIIMTVEEDNSLDRLWIYEHSDSIDSLSQISNYDCRSNYFPSLGLPDGTTSYAEYRHLSCNEKMSNLYYSNEIDESHIINNVIRTYTESDGDDYSVPFENQVGSSGRPYGYISTIYSIARDENVSASVIRGVMIDEDPRKTTMWTALGNPSSSIFCPVWPIGIPPDNLCGENDTSSHAPICDLSNSLRPRLYSYYEIEDDPISQSSYIDSYQLRDENDSGIWSESIFNIEDQFFDAVNSFIEYWGTDSLPQNIYTFQDSLSEVAYNSIYQIPTEKPPVYCDFEISQINDMEFSIEDQSRHCPIFWNWDFGNGDESITQNPDIFFDSCSTYTVSLEIEDIDGNVDSCSSLVFVSIMGDINQDCNLDVLDIVTTINIVLSGGNYNPTVDFNNDQSVDVLDIVFMVNAILVSN